MRKLVLLLAALSAIALPVAACGDDEQGASSALELVPAGSPLYGEVTLNPEGDQEAQVRALLSKFPGEDAGEKLKDLLETAVRESDSSISFKEDIEPWLGDDVAFFVSDLNPEANAAAAAALVATDDEDQAESALEKAAEGKATRQTYKDVEYITDHSGDSDAAGAVFDGFLVVGTELGVKAAIDASKGGETLSDDEGYKEAVAQATEDRLGLFYVDARQLFRSLPVAGLPGMEDLRNAKPFVATFDVDDDGLLVEAEVPEQVARSLGTVGGSASELLTDLPSGSWFATAQGNFGETVDGIVDSVGQAFGGRRAVERQFRAATGLDLQADLIAWMGDVAIFGRGATVQELDGALIVETSDEAASGRLIAAVARIARQQADNPGDSVVQFSVPGGGEGYTLRSRDIPKPVHLFQQRGRVVLAYGDAAAKDAIDPAETLGDSPDFKAARDSLGSDYELSFFLQVKPILDLVDSTEVASDADWQEAKRYLEPLSALVSGSADEGDRARSAFKLVVK